jgi:hypothetical protein
VAFPSIAAGNATRNGTLPPEAAQTLIMKLPTLEECSYVCANYTSWPWGEGQLPRTKANLRIGFEVGDIFLQQTDMDKGHLGRDFEINLDLPVGFNTIGGRAVQGPISIAVGDKSVQLLVSTVNRLSGPVMPKRFKFGLHAAAKVGTIFIYVQLQDPNILFDYHKIECFLPLINVLGPSTHRNSIIL